MITVTISETNGKRKWSHRARTKDAMAAIIRTMNKHFPLSHNFIPDNVDNAPILFALSPTHQMLQWQVISGNRCGRREFAGTSKVPL